LQCIVQRADAVDVWPIRNDGKVEAEADFDVLLGDVILMD